MWYWLVIVECGEHSLCSSDGALAAHMNPALMRSCVCQTICGMVPYNDQCRDCLDVAVYVTPTCKAASCALTLKLSLLLD